MSEESSWSGRKKKCFLSRVIFFWPWLGWDGVSGRREGDWMSRGKARTTTLHARTGKWSPAAPRDLAEASRNARQRAGDKKTWAALRGNQLAGRTPGDCRPSLPINHIIQYMLQSFPVKDPRSGGGICIWHLTLDSRTTRASALISQARRLTSRVGKNYEMAIHYCLVFLFFIVGCLQLAHFDPPSKQFQLKDRSR
jgi:hypothetical protein